MANNNFKKWPKLSFLEHTFRKLFFRQHHLPMLLVAAGITVKDRLIYYSVLGRLIAL